MDYRTDNTIPDGSKSEVDKELPLSLVPYDNSVEELQGLMDSIRNEGKIPVVWNKSKGFMLNYLSMSYPLFDKINLSELADPERVIKFIINKPQKRIDYILADFHHYIGTEDVIDPNTGGIRSLIKDLDSNLKEREEKVYFFVPSSYDLPLELRPFLNVPEGTRKKTGNGYLEKYGQLLTEENYISKIKPVIGADGLIARVVQILCQMESNNPLLVGHSGVGKTAVVEGFAKTLFKGEVPANLNGRMLYSLSLNSLVAGTKYRGQFEERLEGLMGEVLENRDRIIVFIDEMHALLDAGSAEGAVGAGDVLKPLLARGEFPCIGATTFVGAEHLAKDPAFSRRFKKVVVNEPSPEEALEILRGISVCFEKYHSLRIWDAALVAAVDLSIKHIPDGYLPGKAIALVDGAAAYCSMVGEEKMGEEDIMLEVERLQKM